MVAQLVGPGGEIDVSDRPDRQLGIVTVDGTITLPSAVEIANDVGSPVPVNGTVAVTALDIALSALRDTLRGAPTGTLEAIRSLLAGTVAVGGTVNLSATDRALLAALEAVSAVVAGTVSIDNFPATQPVSGPLTNAQLRATPPPVMDDYQSGECLADQSGAGAVLTFTFTTPVQLVVVESKGTNLTSRADPFGGTPTATQGLVCDDATPVYLPVTTSSVKVFAPVLATVAVAGFRRA